MRTSTPPGKISNPVASYFWADGTCNSHAIASILPSRIKIICYVVINSSNNSSLSNHNFCDI
ncbi:hypothetical protein IQ230_17190 [Gloeocapsopsis crepidinum LEGE 06123]|uniref:Uncharacterized protein n=1 Tax=Gloeocapsopsis crepidinum LEGE 06123 TaxID=588587 RepID=A0ABR9UUX7_9CHRO|nr:hypothetical protein [Gloeocapsopsis crepidinum]MBE9192054.1 hypothetical protein [Gloeocapsopsis crepidinum LEGE 06123]